MRLIRLYWGGMDLSAACKTPSAIEASCINAPTA
jgi:hypothetical protein